MEFARTPCIALVVGTGALFDDSASVATQVALVAPRRY